MYAATVRVSTALYVQKRVCCTAQCLPACSLLPETAAEQMMMLWLTTLQLVHANLFTTTPLFYRLYQLYVAEPKHRSAVPPDWLSSDSELNSPPPPIAITHHRTGFTCCEDNRYQYDNYQQDDTKHFNLAFADVSVGSCVWDVSMHAGPGVPVGSGTGFLTVMRWGTVQATCSLNNNAANCGGPECDRMSLSLQGVCERVIACQPHVCCRWHVIQRMLISDSTAVQASSMFTNASMLLPEVALLTHTLPPPTRPPTLLLTALFFRLSFSSHATRHTTCHARRCPPAPQIYQAMSIMLT